jgi:predicted permease
MVSVNPVAGDFFETTGMHLLLGRTLLPSDKENSPLVAVVNEAFVKAYFGDQNPIGRYYTHGRDTDSEKVEIVGVVRDARFGGIRATPWPTAYVSFAQRQYVPSACFTVRCAVPPDGILGFLPKAVAEIEPNLPLTWMRTQKDELENHLLEREHRFARLSALFGGLAVVLVCIGLHGLIAYSVHQRTSEIGLRMALGALPRTIEAMFVREFVITISLGLMLGIAGAVTASRFVASSLYQVTPTDPLTYFAVALLLMSAALLAAWLPARRAAKVDPMVALRAE